MSEKKDNLSFLKKLDLKIVTKSIELKELIRLRQDLTEKVPKSVKKKGSVEAPVSENIII